MYHKKTTHFLSLILQDTEKKNPPCIIILCREFERRINRNNKYGVRAFARDIGLNAAHLSRILQRKRTMRYKTAQILCDRLGLLEEEKQKFLKSAREEARLNKRRGASMVTNVTGEV